MVFVFDTKRQQGYGFAQTPSVPLLGGRNSKASVPKAKTVRWTVFSESVAETLNFAHAAASECDVLASRHLPSIRLLRLYKM